MSSRDAQNISSYLALFPTTCGLRIPVRYPWLLFLRYACKAGIKGLYPYFQKKHKASLSRIQVTKQQPDHQLLLRVSYLELRLKVHTHKSPPRPDALKSGAAAFIHSSIPILQPLLPIVHFVKHDYRFLIIVFE